MGLMKKLLFGSPKRNKNKTTTARKTTRPSKSNNSPSMAQIKHQMAEDDRKIERLLAAKTAVEKSDDFYKAMDDYKKAIDALSGHSIDSHRMRFASAYIKHGDLDKAWTYLNSLIMSNRNLTPKIRKEQVRILKKEGKWSEALRFLLFHYVERCDYGMPGFNRDAFLKDLKPIANKLGLNDEEREYFANLLEAQIDKGNYKIQPLDDAYRDFCSSKGWF